MSTKSIVARLKETSSLPVEGALLFASLMTAESLGIQMTMDLHDDSLLVKLGSSTIDFDLRLLQTWGMKYSDQVMYRLEAISKGQTPLIEDTYEMWVNDIKRRGVVHVLTKHGKNSEWKSVVDYLNRTRND